MMYHHDARDYKVAVSEAAQKMREKLENMFHASKERIEKVIEQVQEDVPEDAIVRGKRLDFEAGINTGQLLINVDTGAGTYANQIHPHALDQISYKAKVDHLAPVIRDLVSRGEWGRQLAAQNLREIFGQLNGDRFLLRSVRGELRGFLSDQYRRLDSRPLLDAFVGAMQQFGARPVDGFALTTKIRIRAMLPMVFEPVPGEVLAFGAELSDSDYGDGKLALSAIMLRMWCTNLAVTEDVLSQVHLGKRLPEHIQLSQQTYDLDTKAMASAINDLAGKVLGPDAVTSYSNAIVKANEDKVGPQEIKAWIKKNLNKGEGDQVTEKFASADVELLPPGQTKWRFSNAVSWLANETTDERRRVELQDLAGALIK